MVYKFEMFEAANLTLHGHYTHVYTVSKGIGMNTERNIAAKKGIQEWSLMMKKYGHNTHST